MGGACHNRRMPDPTAGHQTARRDLRALPKAHLHLHLEGAMRLSTLRELGETHGIAVPDTASFGDFDAFLALYLAACNVLCTPADLARLVREVAEDGAAAGAAYIEPSIYLPRHRERFGSDDQTLEIILNAARQSAADTGVGIGIMVAANRSAPPSDALEQAHLAARYVGQGVVSFGMGNDEARFPPEPFADAFAVTHEAGLINAPHAGEVAGAASVRGALDTLQPQRIQHGVRALEDPALVERIARDGICLDVCPISNVALGVVASLAEHPLPRLLDAGARVSLNCDDPLFFGNDLLGEYEQCRDTLNLDDATLAQIAQWSLEASGAPADLKRASLARIEMWVLGGG
jgi:adenosine deaminase